MDKVGKYRLGRRLHLSGVGGVYEAGGGEAGAGGERVVKVFEPRAGVWSEAHVREGIDAFLLRGKTQRIFAKQSAYWAPVHEVGGIPVQEMGRDEPPTDAAGDEEGTNGGGGHYRAGGAYVVVERHERSVQSLIEGRVKVTNEDLRVLFTGVIGGLLDARKIGGRAHGNLKPTNILLQRSEPLSGVVVRLSDPAADGGLTRKSEEKDLADMGRVLYELVNGRPYGGGTIGPSREWKRLGPNGEDWRLLCNAWLEGGAGGAGDERDLTKIVARMDTWRAKPRNVPVVPLAAAGLVVVVVGGAAIFYFSRAPTADFDQPHWAQLCLSYDSWFGDFVAGMSTDTTRKKFAANPDYPVGALKIVEASAAKLDAYDPTRLAKSARSLTDLAVMPTPDAKSGQNAYKTRQADDLIAKVSAALQPGQWGLLTKLDQTEKAYRERGWLKPANAIKGLIAAAEPPGLPANPPGEGAPAPRVERVDELANIERTVAAGKAVEQVEARWAKIQSELKMLPGGGAGGSGGVTVPLLAAFPKFAEDLARSPDEPGTLQDVQALAAAFDQVQGVLDALVKGLNDPAAPVDFAALAADPGAQAPADGKPTMAEYLALPALARGYVKLAADPRAAVDWTKALGEIQSDIIAKINEANPADANLPALKQRSAALAQFVAAWKPIAPVAKNRAKLESLVTTARTNLTRLQNDGNTWVAPYIIDPAVYIAKQKARLTTSPLAHATPVVYARWEKAQNALIEAISATPQELKKYTYFKRVDAAFDTLEKDFLGFDAAIDPRPAGLAEIGGTGWQHVIAERVETVYREQALTDLMASPLLKWSADHLPELQDAGYISYRKQRLSAYEGLRQDAVALIGDFTTIEARLNGLELRDAGTGGNGGTSWRELYAKWASSKSPLMGDATIAAALKPIADRVNALLALDKVADYKSLVAAAMGRSGTGSTAGGAAPEVVLTAWRKLGEAAVAQQEPVLTDEAAVEGQLARELATLTAKKAVAADHAAALEKEIAAQRPIRWRRWARTLSSADAIQTALDQAQAFGVTLTAQSDPQMYYDAAFYALRKKFDAHPKDAEMKAAAQAFITAVGTMPANVSGNAGVKALLARMLKPLTQDPNQETSSAGAGPKLAGWEQDDSHEGVRVFYYPNRQNPQDVLQFVRVQAGQKTVYLCSTEMSVGLFADILNDTHKLTDLDNASKPEAERHWFKIPAENNDQWTDVGPRAWRVTGGKVQPNTHWLYQFIPQMDGIPYYAGQAAADPGVNAPMQVVTPWTAMYVARLVGCRLPTSEEWTAAYQRFEGSGAGVKDAWNLRGAAWQAQQAYAAKEAANGLSYADQGIFLTDDLMFAGINADKALPWKSADLAKLFPGRISTDAELYKGSIVWFRDVGHEPGMSTTVGSAAMHDLVGNVAEYVFDGPSATAVIKDNAATTGAIDAAVNGGKEQMFVIGGSAMSPPQLAITQKQSVDLTVAQSAVGYSDVGFRLAYTAPIDSITDVLASVFKDPPYLSGADASAGR